MSRSIYTQVNGRARQVLPITQLEIHPILSASPREGRVYEDLGVPPTARMLSPSRFEVVADPGAFLHTQAKGGTEEMCWVVILSDEEAALQALRTVWLNPGSGLLDKSEALYAAWHRFGIKQVDIARVAGTTQSTIAHYLRLRTKLASPVKKLVEEGKLSLGHVKLLMTVSGDRQIELGISTVRLGWSVKKLQEALRADKLDLRPKGKSPDILKLERDLTDALGQPVTIDPEEGGGGVIRIRYHTNEEADGVIERISRVGAPRY